MMKKQLRKTKNFGKPNNDAVDTHKVCFGDLRTQKNNSTFMGC